MVRVDSSGDGFEPQEWVRGTNVNAISSIRPTVLTATIFLRNKFPLTLAFGTHLKNTICALNGNEARISSVHQNLEEEGDYRGFCEAIADMRRWLGGAPEVIAYDLHPDYTSTKVAAEVAKELPGVALIGVQHHHAHIASCMVERGLEGPVIGLALDGTGYGLDGTIWGGEILIAGMDSFTRAGYIQPVPLPGGARAVMEPWRIALSYLRHAFNGRIHDLGIDVVSRRDRIKLDLVLKMIERRVNSPLTSSCGRLFDGVAAILGVVEQVQFEGEAAIELERRAGIESDVRGSRYQFALGYHEDCIIVDPAPMILELVRDCQEHADVDECSRRFHNGLIHAFASTVDAIAGRTGIRKVVFSGGCFLNNYLRNGLLSLLEERKFSVYTPLKLPIGDAGLSLGQAVVAASVFQNQIPDRADVAGRLQCFPT